MNEISGVNYFGIPARMNGRTNQRRLLSSLGHDTVSFGAERALKSLKKAKPYILPLVTIAALVSGSGVSRAEQPANSVNATIQGRQRAYTYPYLPAESARAIDKALEDGNLYLDDTKCLRNELLQYCKFCKEESEANPVSVWANVALISYFVERPENPDYLNRLNEYAVCIASEVIDIYYPEGGKNLTHAFNIAGTFGLNTQLTDEQNEKLRAETDVTLQKSMFKEFLLENNGIQKTAGETVEKSSLTSEINNENVGENTLTSEVNNENINESPVTSQVKDEIIDGQNMAEATLDLIKSYDTMLTKFQKVKTETGTWYVIGYGTAFKPEEIEGKIARKVFNISGNKYVTEFSTDDELSPDIADKLALYHFLDSEEYIQKRLGNISVKDDNYLILPLEITYLAGPGIINKAPKMMQALRDLNTYGKGTQEYNDALIRFIEETSDIGLSDTIEGKPADEGHFQRHIAFANLMLKRLGYDESRMRNHEEVGKDYTAERKYLDSIDSDYENNRKKAAHDTARKYVRSIIFDNL